MEAVRKKILIVEDEGIIAIDMKRKLVQAGYDVTAVATDSNEAVAAIELATPDLVLMDIRLRGPEDGIQTAERIRRTYRLPIMYVTAHADAETLERAKITEPFGYIVKPFAGVNFHAQIEMALWKHTMEQKLRESEAWLSTTFSNVADALITTDAAGNIRLINAPATKLTGWEPEDARGRGLFEVFQIFNGTTGLPAVHPLEAIYDGRPLDTGSSIFTLMGRDNTPTVVEVELSANRDDQGLLLGIIAVFRNITERRNSEERERQLQKKNAIALLASGLAAELEKSQGRMSAPLTSLLNRAKGQTLSLLEEIQKHCSQQRNLVQQLAGLGRTEQHPPVIVDLNHTLTTLGDQFRKILGRSRSLNLSLQPGIPWIRVEVEELRENLLRLIVEAREAMPDGGVVDIETNGVVSANGDHRVQLAVRDSGKNIRAGARGQVFDPYYQSRSGTRNSGMSLALVYQFVALNGGSVEVGDAGGTERGTRFLVTFPAATRSHVPPGDGRDRYSVASA
jgi:two-component system cell cycle sensor histidine kinase/response regulator CckA